MVIFHCYVSSPEGIFHEEKIGGRSKNHKLVCKDVKNKACCYGFKGCCSGTPGTPWKVLVCKYVCGKKYINYLSIWDQSASRFKISMLKDSSYLAFLAAWLETIGNFVTGCDRGMMKSLVMIWHESNRPRVVRLWFCHAPWIPWFSPAGFPSVKKVRSAAIAASQGCSGSRGDWDMKSTNVNGTIHPHRGAVSWSKWRQRLSRLSQFSRTS